MISGTEEVPQFEINTSAFGLLVMTQFPKTTPFPKGVIARERSDRGNLTPQPSESRQ
jgi:hypothetical protein